MKKFGSPLGIQTLAQLQQANRRLDHLRRDTNRALSAMRRDGAALHLSYERGRALWRLSTGQFVRPDVAAVLIASPNVIAVGDSLFPDLVAGQTWRFTDDRQTA
jgi:hypothetical protein